MSLQTQLEALQQGLPITETPSLEQAVHWAPSTNFPIHRWFRYREGFSPHLFSHFPNAKHRFDPFCGCGTTLLESVRQGVRSTGIDVNPLATFVAKVKTRSYSEKEQRMYELVSREVAERYSAVEPAPRPEYRLLDKLFLPESMDTLLRMKKVIDTVEDEKVHDLLFLSWLAILENASNVFKEGNGLKYRNKRRRPGQYETIPDHEWIPRFFGPSVISHVINLWNRKCNEIIVDMKQVPFKDEFTPDIRTGSCLVQENIEVDHPVDLAIFSPPYANRFDYFEAFKMELWMGGFVKTRDDMAELRAASMRNNLSARRDLEGEPWPALEPFLDYMDPTSSSVRMGIKKTLAGYFEDTRILLQRLRSVLEDQGRVAIVVGNSAYARSIVPTDVLVAKIGEEEGYRVERIHVARHLHVSSQQRLTLIGVEKYMRESIVVLEKI